MCVCMGKHAWEDSWVKQYVSTLKNAKPKFTKNKGFFSRQTFFDQYVSLGMM